MLLNKIFFAIKYNVYRLFQRITLGYIIGKVPANIIRSLEESSYKKEIADLMLKTYVLSPPDIAEYNFTLNYPHYFRRNKSFESKKCFVLKNVCTSPESGVIWTHNGKILQESVGSLNRVINWGGVLEEIRRYEKYKLYDVCYTVYSSGKGYYHWLFESLPNLLYILKVMNDVNIIISSKSPQYLVDSLKIIIGENYGSRVIVLDDVVSCQKLIFTQNYAYSGFVHQNEVGMIKSVFQKGKDIHAAEKGLKIYISRRYASKRKVKNESKLEAELLKRNYKVIYLEKLKLEEQMEIFQKAEKVVGLHGAGLSNIVWKNGDLDILEIFHGDVFNDCYARLSVQMGFQYSYFIDDSKKKFGQYQLNIEKIVSYLEQLKFV